jgi:hypothetical protein
LKPDAAAGGKLPKVKTIRVGKQDVLVADEEFKTLIEDWNEYETASGVKIRVRLIVNKILRLLHKDGRPVFDDQGEPRIAVQSQNIVITTGGPSAEDDADGEVH